QFTGNLLLHLLEDADHVGGAFHFPEVRCVYQYALVARGDGLLEMLPWLEVKTTQVDEVRDDADFALDVEMIQCLCLQVFGNRRNSVRLGNRKGNYRTIAGVFAHQGDVGAVQRGDHGDVDAISGQDLLGHECG